MSAYDKHSIDHMSVLFMLKAVISVCQYTRCFKKKGCVWDASPLPGYLSNHFCTWVERGTVRVKCLAQE